ncbi:MAG TPA: lytic transglycosylase domain-containing protein, partial [Bacteroidia bacterium]|nr:lytic transglycosylase domain-containing protein [Bacteroidia bacterium]
MKQLLAASLLGSVMLCCSLQVVAQDENPVLEQALANGSYDPIAATLDSLVNLNYIARLNGSASGTESVSNFQPSEIPSYADDIYRKRIEKIQTPIPLAYNSQVQEYINMYAMRKRGLTERVMGLANLYFPLYEQIFDQQGLPLEFKYLSIVESALNPTAVSRVGATGLWQFMLSTGKLYKLKVNSYLDERRDPVKSTMAAAQYFKDMYSIYNDWLLVIAAYNCGAGNVNRAIARSGGKKTFWEISPYLPRETRGYVPAFIAVTYLMNYSSEHNLTSVPPMISYFEADTVMVDRKMQLKDIADAINVPVELLSYLNPMYKKGVIPDGDEPMTLRLPTNKINTYIASIDNIYQQQESMTMASIAASGNQEDESDENASLITRMHKVK